MRIEVGAGEKPHPDYDVHADVLALPGIDVVCRLEHLPFAPGSATALRANHVLEHQSWELVEATLGEWTAVLEPGAEIYIGVPDAFYLVGQWVAGELTAVEANYWIMGGHSDRDAHKGVDDRGVPLWIWNAHHTLFEAGWLRDLLTRAGLEAVTVESDGLRNLVARARRPPQEPIALDGNKSKRETVN